jgi:outer membrane protein
VLNVIALALIYFKDNAQRIAYVNSGTLVNNYKGMVSAKKDFQQKLQAWKANIDTLGNEVQQRIFELEKNGSKMTVKEKKLSQELIRTKQDQFAQYQQAINAQAKDEEAKLTNAVIAEINSYLKKYGESKGYSIVMAATEYGNIAYGDENLDITDEVLTGLNNEYKGR